jgi:integrase/recombinase XerD
MLTAASERDAALVAVLLAAAGRIGEVTLLCWSDIQGSQLIIPAEITKQGRSRTAELPGPALMHLQHWRTLCPETRRGWLFPGRPVAHPISVRGAQKRIQALAQMAGLEGVSSHSFRRSAITAAAQAGLPMAAVAEIGGHRDRRSLERYIDGPACRAQADKARALLFAV